MTMPGWLSRMNPPPPHELATAIQEALPDKSENPTAEELLTAAETLLDKVLRTDCETRSSAMHLLAVDALVTQSLLRASADASTAEDFAEQAMRRVSIPRE